MTTKVFTALQEIRKIARRELPTGKANRIINKCDKISSELKKQQRKSTSTKTNTKN